MVKNDWLDKIWRILLIIFAIYIIYQLFRVLLGGSWEFEEIIIALLILNLGLAIETRATLSRHLGKHEGYDKAKENPK